MKCWRPSDLYWFGELFLAVGIFFQLYIPWFQYRFQVTAMGDLAVYMDGMTVTPQNVAAKYESHSA